MFLIMQLSNRTVQLSLTALAVLITGCTSSLPDLPRELNPDANVNQPVQSEPVAARLPSPPAPSTAPTPAPPAPTTALPPAPPALPPPLPAPAPSPVQLPASGELSFSVADNGIRVLHKASYNPFDRDNGKSFRALKSLEIYRSELGRHSVETTKAVDFNTAQVLVSSIGEKPSGGYTVSATDIEEFDDNIVVTVVQTIPGPNCVTTQGATHPFEFIVVPSRKPIEIFERQKIDQC